MLFRSSMVVDSLTEEMETKTLETLLAAPLSLTGIWSAKIFAAVLLAVMQIAAWMLLLRLNGITLANLLWVPIDLPIRRQAQKLPNLEAYCQRMKARYFAG